MFAIGEMSNREIQTAPLTRKVVKVSLVYKLSETAASSSSAVMFSASGDRQGLLLPSGSYDQDGGDAVVAMDCLQGA